jgi:CRP-like cAMP-binding protein
LPLEEQERWLPQLERIDMPLGQVLYESGTTLSHVYFPTTSIVSLLYVMENGSSAEIAVVGNEGIVGISLFMGGESTPSRAVVQSAGEGYRLKANTIKDEFNRAPVLHLLLRYTQALITQMAQTAVCNRHHSLDQQLCRWLLLSLDRLSGSELVMTQELIANMLGVRREGVTEAAVKLQKAGLIKYARGRITVVDRPALESRSLRVLRGRQEGVRPPVARHRRDLSVYVRWQTVAPRSAARRLCDQPSRDALGRPEPPHRKPAAQRRPASSRTLRAG